MGSQVVEVQGIDVDADDSELRVTITLFNLMQETLYLHDTADDWHGLWDGRRRRDQPSVSMLGADAAVLGWVAPPLTLPLPAHPRRRLCTPIAATATHRCEARLSLPLYEWNANTAPARAPCEPTSVGRLVFKLQLTRSRDVVKRRQVDSGLFAIRADAHEVLLEEHPLSSPLSLLRRLDQVSRLHAMPRPDSFLP